MLTKSGFMLYLQAPMHLWAHKNQQIEVLEPSPYDQYLKEQGLRVEGMATEYLQDIITIGYQYPEVIPQKTFTDGHFQARADLVVYDRETRASDIYEIKSATAVSKIHLYDAAFQRLVCEASVQVRDVYIVHLNKDFVKNGEIAFNRLFVVENVTAAVMDLVAEVHAVRVEAWQVATQLTPARIPTCQKPKTCPCPTLCHPNLPEHPIYELTRLNRNKALELAEQGLLAIREIPESYPLSERQKRQAQAVKMGTPIIDHPRIRTELSQLQYPLYFLDYETCSPGIPMFDGYRPYQHVVFQYSLHLISTTGNEPEHYEYLSTGPGDPVPELLEHLADHIGDSGSVIVWNQAFETSRNREMAERYPAFAGILMGINARIYDLMVVFSAGHYLHPDFHGSYSIKAVLPVMAPDFERAYADLPVSKGNEAMLAWLAIVSGDLSPEETEAKRRALLRYCALDSQAMVEIWKALSSQ